MEVAGISFRNLVAGFFIASLFFVISSQESFASEITYPVSSGLETLTFRDITNTDPTPPVTFSLDKSAYNEGENAIFTINSISR